MEVADQNLESPRPFRKDLRKIGFWGTALWLLGSIPLIVILSKPSQLQANEWGDLFGGLFAPVAFFWLVLGFIQQGRELQLSTQMLRLQAEELRQSVEQQRELVEVSRRTADSGVESADSAARAADAAWAAVHTNRAWICYAPWQQGIIRNSRVGRTEIREGFVFQLAWTNAGQTPALDVDASCNYQVIPLGEAIPSWGHIVDEARLPQKTVVGPGTTFQAPPAILDDNESGLFRSQKWVLIAHSRVTYRDIYSSKTRVSEVCMQIFCQGTAHKDNGKLEDQIEVTAVGPQNIVT